MITSQVVIPDTCLHLTSQNISQQGLFPSNFVTTDLDADARGERKRSVVFNEEVKLWFDCFLPDWFVFRFDFCTWSFAHPDANLWAFLKVISGWGEGGGAGDLPCSGNYRPGDKLPTLLTPNQPRNVSSEQDLNPVVNAPWGWSHNRRGWPPRHAQAGAAGDYIQEKIYVGFSGYSR